MFFHARLLLIVCVSGSHLHYISLSCHPSYFSLVKCFIATVTVTPISSMTNAKLSENVSSADVC